MSQLINWIILKTVVKVGHPLTKLSGSAYEIDTYIIHIIGSLKSEPTCNLIIPGSRLLISSLREHMLKSRGLPRDSTGVLEALPGKHNIKRQSPSIFYLLRPIYGAKCSTSVRRRFSTSLYILYILNRSYQWPPYIFFTCSESKNRPYKI